MAIKNDPAFYQSEWERMEGDRYFTEPPASAALARRIPAGINTIWEPAAGRGDLVRVLSDFGYNVLASDVNLSEFDTELCRSETFDFLGDGAPEFFLDEEIDMIATNPPFGDLAEPFLRRALEYKNVRCVALLLRSEWRHGVKRLDLFRDHPHYAGVIELTWRPRWDWWFRDKPEASPRHNYAWFLWDRQHTGLPTEQFATRKD